MNSTKFLDISALYLLSIVKQSWGFCSQLSPQKVKRAESLSWWGIGIFLSILCWGNVSQAQQITEAEIESLIRQLPSTTEQLNNSSQVRKLQNSVQQQAPLLYYFLQLQQPQPRNLSQESEAQIREILQRPPSLQQRILQQQIEEIEQNRD